MKVCLVGSSGGHLTHLYMLKPFWQNKDRFWVTFNKEDAKSKLTSSNQSIQEIADLVGYHDTFTFSKAFKRYSGYSPSTYRKHFS